MTSARFPSVRTTDADLARVQDNIQQVVSPVIAQVRATPICGAPPPKWIAPTLLNGFANVGATDPNGAGGSKQQADAAGFHKDALGYVHCKGLVSKSGGGAASTVVFVLPAGYRPLRVRNFATVAGLVPYQFQALAVDGLGNVYVLLAQPSGVLSLEFSFLGEA